MNTYSKFILNVFLRSFSYVFLVMFSLVLILNILTELEFFRNINVKFYFPIYISALNAPSLIFEMFPFIFLIGTQLFFISLFNDNQIQIFKFSGLKNSKILTLIGIFSFLLGLFAITVFYNFSSNLKNFYLELKNNYSADDKYLAVITKNGLWIKDNTDGKINIINALKIDNEHLIDTFITQFDENYEVIKNIKLSSMYHDIYNYRVLNLKDKFRVHIPNEINDIIESYIFDTEIYRSNKNRNMCCFSTTEEFFSGYILYGEFTYA